MNKVPIVYYVRAASAGRFIIDSAYIKSAKTPAWGMSDTDEIQIAEK
jgi:hypothetical protein